jgi:hypothetical protein
MSSSRSRSVRRTRCSAPALGCASAIGAVRGSGERSDYSLAVCLGAPTGLSVSTSVTSPTGGARLARIGDLDREHVVAE